MKSTVSVLHLWPPYSNPHREGIPAGRLPGLVPGSLLVVRVDNWSQWKRTERWSMQYGIDLAAAPLLLWTPEVFERRPLVAFEAARRGFRRILISEALASTELVKALGGEPRLEEVRAWLGRHCTRRQARTLNDVQALLAAGVAAEGVKSASARLLTPLDTLEKRLRRSGWPPPGRILRLGRLLRLLPLIQGYSRPVQTELATQTPGDLTLELIARCGGVSSAAHLRREFRELLGALPSAFRSTLGWEFALHAWWVRWCCPRP